uniref:Uncharacterized protein n=1 Tax=Rhizophora mucronata TaxID=61149 RepID=A0A2P2ISP2_RHIMU
MYKRIAIRNERLTQAFQYEHDYAVSNALKRTKSITDVSLSLIMTQ